MKKIKTLFELVGRVANYDERWGTVLRMMHQALPSDMPLVYNDSLKTAIESVIDYTEKDIKRHNDEYEPVGWFYDDDYEYYLRKCIEHLKELLKFLQDNNLSKYAHTPEYVMMDDIFNTWVD